MKYHSTRGQVKNQTFEEALFAGFAIDGGLLVPDFIPKLPVEKFEEWASMDFASLTVEILKLFIDESELDERQLREIVGPAFKNFNVPDVLRLRSCSNGLKVAELYHGPTKAFKDIALQVIGRLVEFFLKRKSRHINILIGTSGDTGAAAIHGFRGLPSVDVFVLYPKGLITDTQELYMTTVTDDNIHCISANGTSDELDAPIRNIFQDKTFTEEYNVCCANSVNCSRIVLQVVAFVYIYLKNSKKEEPLKFVVPFGGGGNASAGFLAKKMGLNIELVVTVNKNDIMHKFLKTSELQIGQPSIHTLASAMDIQMPCNVERLLYWCSDNNVSTTTTIMKALENGEKVTFADGIMTKIREMIADSYSCDDQEIMRTMERCWKEENYPICPHTATAVAYHYKCLADSPKAEYICVSTASIEKFPEVIKLSKITPQSQSVNPFDGLPQKFLTVDKNKENLDSFLRNEIRIATQKYFDKK